MLNNKIKGCLILTLILLLTISVVNASEVSNDTTTDTISTQTVEPVTQPASTNNEKIITKTENNKNSKEAYGDSYVSI